MARKTEKGANFRKGDFIEQSIEGFCDSFSRPEKYTNPSYM